MIFELNEEQCKNLKKWQNKIKSEFGCYGSYDYIFTPTSIGYSVKIRSHITNVYLDLTDVASW